MKFKILQPRRCEEHYEIEARDETHALQILSSLTEEGRRRYVVHQDEMWDDGDPLIEEM